MLPTGLLPSPALIFLRASPHQWSSGPGGIRIDYCASGLSLLHVCLQTGGDHPFQVFAHLVQKTNRPISRWRVRRSSFLSEQNQSRCSPFSGVSSLPHASIEEVSQAGGHKVYRFDLDSAWNSVWNRRDVPGGHLPYCPRKFLIGNFLLLLPFQRTTFLLFLAVREGERGEILRLLRVGLLSREQGSNYLVQRFRVHTLSLWGGGRSQLC
jgi:hypothetical protein